MFWIQEQDQWEVIISDLALDNPLEAKRIEEGCSYTDVAFAWVNAQRKKEGFGYKHKD